MKYDMGNDPLVAGAIYHTDLRQVKKDAEFLQQTSMVHVKYACDWLRWTSDAQQKANRDAKIARFVPFYKGVAQGSAKMAEHCQKHMRTEIQEAVLDKARSVAIRFPSALPDTASPLLSRQRELR